MTRRELLAAALAAGRLRAAERIDISRISVLTDEAAASPAEAIAFVKKYGMRWMELRAVPGGRGAYANMPEAELKAAAREFSQNGVGVSFLDASLLKFPLPGTEPVRRTPEAPEARKRRIERDAAQFERRMEDLRSAIRAAHILGTDKVRVFAFSRVAEPMRLLPRVADILGEMVEAAGREKIRLLIENEGSCNVATCAELVEIARLIPSRWFGINWDPLNGSVEEKAFPEGYNLLPKERIGNVHIKGRTVLDFPQRMDWAAIFRRFAADGYTGQFGLETHIFGPKIIEYSHLSMQEIIRVLERA